METLRYGASLGMILNRASLIVRDVDTPPAFSDTAETPNREPLGLCAVFMNISTTNSAAHVCTIRGTVANPSVATIRYSVAVQSVVVARYCTPSTGTTVAVPAMAVNVSLYAARLATDCIVIGTV